MGTELVHADGQTDETKLIFTFRNSANAPKNHNINICDKCVRIWQSSNNWEGHLTHENSFDVIN